MIGREGGRADFDSVSVSVPAGSTTTELEIQAAAPIGVVDSEWFGQPVSVEHSQLLSEPVEVTWELEISDEAARSGVLARWDESLGAWEVSRKKVTVSDGVATARLRSFSTWTFVADQGADVSQSLGTWFGTRIEPPSCTGKPLHDWVDGVVDPDEDTPAAPILVCFEPDKRERVAVRVGNNRTFTQRLKVIRGGAKWVWTWPGAEYPGVETAVINAARTVFDAPSDNTYLMPPTHEVAVGLGRPDASGSHFIQVESDVDAITIFVDVVAYAAGQTAPGGLDNPVANAFLQAIYECGGKHLLGDGLPGDGRDALRTVIQAVGACSSEIVRYDSEFGKRFEHLAQQQIRKHPGKPAAAWAKAYRLVHQAARKFAVLAAGEFAFYLSDQFANSLVGGNFSFSIRGRGQPQALGRWTPTCVDTSTDSDRLFRNLALQDRFADTSREFWEFPQWAPSARQAIRPLRSCDQDYLATLATFLPSDWGDQKAAQVVADQILTLVDSPRTLDDFVGEWYVHGGSLTINEDGSAISRGHGICPDGYPITAWCDDVMSLAVVPTAEGIRLTVTRVWIESDGQDLGFPEYASASTGSFYEMWLTDQPGLAETRLHNDDGIIEGANGLGNPYLCRPGLDTEASSNCGA